LIPAGESLSEMKRAAKTRFAAQAAILSVFQPVQVEKHGFPE
jgi:hypothetical protein